MIDSHCHLNDERFDGDLEEVLQRSWEAGVRRAVIVGYNLVSSRRAIEIARSHASEAGTALSAVVGVSTHEAASWNREAETEIRELLERPEVVGLGETGLDDFYPTPSRADQERALIAQIGIANEKNVPVVFHLRDAADDFFAILDRERFTAGGVLHCFTGDERAMRMGVERGLFISFSGIVTFKKGADLLAVALKTPLENLLVETDSPYLAPVPHRGKRCEPCHVVHTAELIASSRGISYGEFEGLMEGNLLRLFPRISQKK
jgi:TatD DNase family protein